MSSWLKLIKRLHQKLFVSIFVLGVHKNSCVPVKRNELPGLIKDVYNTVHSLEKSESDEE